MKTHTGLHRLKADDVVLDLDYAWTAEPTSPMKRLPGQAAVTVVASGDPYCVILYSCVFEGRSCPTGSAKLTPYFCLVLTVDDDRTVGMGRSLVCPNDPRFVRGRPRIRDDSATINGQLERETIRVRVSGELRRARRTDVCDEV
jgi:hypothetical protein